MLGENIQRYRKLKGFTQVDLADSLNVSVMDVSSWEDNVSKPSLDQLINISKLLGISLDELIAENDGDAIVSVVKKTDNKTVAQKTKRSKIIIPVIIIAAVVLIVVGALFAVKYLTPKPFSDDTKAIQEAEASVVKIICYNYDGDEFCTGSGFIAFDDKTVVTNYHVIDDAYSAIVSTETDKAFDVDTILYASEEEDIAVLQLVDSTGLTPLTLGDSHSIEKGDTVTAIGSPLGIRNTVSQGILSGRMFENDIELLQFTASISSGSSGGALFNDKGEVIGITFASLVDGQNINLAIPIEILSQEKFEKPITIQKFCEKNNNYLLVLKSDKEYNKPIETTFSNLKSEPQKYDYKVISFSAYISSINDDGFTEIYYLTLCNDITGSYITDETAVDSYPFSSSVVIAAKSRDSKLRVDKDINVGDLVRVIGKFSYSGQDLDEHNRWRAMMNSVLNEKAFDNATYADLYSLTNCVIYKTTDEAK